MVDRKSPDVMRISQTGLDLIKHFEGWRPEAYDDGAGYETIGYGHKLTEAELRTGLIEAQSCEFDWTDGITKEQGEIILEVDVQWAEAGVGRHVQVPLAQHEFDALVSWTFNLGTGNLQRSTILRVLNNEKYHAVPEQIKRWNRAGGRVLEGLVRRREAEAELWQGEWHA